jgi:hypothetical protein
MKHLFCFRNIVLLIVLCSLSSCNLTGDLFVEKRKYTQGYYLAAPSASKKTVHKISHSKKHDRPAQAEAAEPAADNMVVSADPKFYPGITTSDQSSSPPEFNSVPPDTIRSVKAGTKDKMVQKVRTLTPEKPGAPDEKKTDIFSIVALAAACFSYSLVPLMFVSMASALMSIFTVIIFGSPLVAIALGIIGLIWIKRNEDKLKGKKFAIAAIILGGSFYILLVAGLLISLLIFM